MALLFIDSFDHYATADLGRKWTSVADALIEAGAGRCGTAGLHLTGGGGVSKGLVFATPQATVGFAAKVIDAETVTGGGPQFSWLVSSGGGFHLYLRLLGSEGSLAVIRQGWPTEEELGRTAPDLIRYDTWYYIEWQALIHSSAGSVEVRVNGVPVLTLSGIRTLGHNPDGSNQPADIRATTFFSPNNVGWACDDVYILDGAGSAPLNTFLGDVRVEYLRPRAAGALQQWTPVGAATHWDTVDDLTPDYDTTYLQANAPDLTDTNLYQLTGLPAGPVYGAQLSLLAEKTEAGPRLLAPVTNGVVGTSFAPSELSYSYFHTPYPTNPATGLPWTVAEINAIDAGVKVVS